MDTPVKHCTKCKRDLPLTSDYFYRTSARKDGYSGWCKTCNKANDIQRHRVKRPTVKPGHKICTVCKRELPVQQFGANKLGKDGLRSHCKDCCHAEYKSRFHPGDPTRKLQRRLYYQAHQEQTRKQLRAYRKAHPERGTAKYHRRRARKLSAEGQFTADDVKAQYKRQRGRCYYCPEKVGDTYHVDHVIPLSRGGSNGPDNIVIACPHCNTSKCDKLPSEWPEGGRLI